MGRVVVAAPHKSPLNLSYYYSLIFPPIFIASAAEILQYTTYYK
jgi:hypothetical protein